MAAPADAGTPTIGNVLREAVVRLRAAGSERPRLDAELLIGHVTGLERTAVVAHPERPLDRATLVSLQAAVARRERGEPVAYIRGIKEFFGLPFHVDRRALIPRPETERLVELAIDIAVERLRSPGSHAAPGRLRIVDVGTGSGAIAIAVADALRSRGLLDRVDLLATDRSPEVLDLAHENAAALGLAGAVRLHAADLLPADRLFDLVLANLPYIPTAAIPGLPIAASFEPREALDGGEDGLGVIRRLLVRLPEVLGPAGVSLLEIGSDEGPAVCRAVRQLGPGWRCDIEPDLSGAPRVAVVTRAPAAAPDTAGASDAAPTGG